MYHWHWPQYIIACLFALKFLLGVPYVGIKHMRADEERGTAMSRSLGAGIAELSVLYVLYAGGFWG